MTDFVVLGLRLLMRLPIFRSRSKGLNTKYFLRSVLDHLEDFRSWDDGFNGPLTRIASQGLSVADIKEIERCLARTEPEFSRLARKLLQVQRGMSELEVCEWVVGALSEIFGVQSGPVWVRSWLWLLLDRSGCSHNDVLFVLRDIKQTNELLEQLREAIQAELGK